MTRKTKPIARPGLCPPSPLLPLSPSAVSSPQDAPPAVASRHARAIVAILHAHRIPAGSRLLDVGCGLGRQASALARQGYHVTALDIRCDSQALSRWQADASRQPHLHFLAGDARALPLAGSGLKTRARAGKLPTAPKTKGPEAGPTDFRAALLLYNTFALFHTNDDALALLAELRRVLAPGGLLIIDNVCRTIWKEIATGRYADGLSEDGLWQMLWLPGRNLFALRYGDQVAPRSRRPRRGETLYRAWSLDELDLLLRLSGWTLDAATAIRPFLLARPS